MRMPGVQRGGINMGCRRGVGYGWRLLAKLSGIALAGGGEVEMERALQKPMN